MLAGPPGSEGTTKMRKATAWVAGKYLLIQVPGWIVVGLLLACAVRWWGLATGAAWVLFAAWLVKDALLFPVLRAAYEPGDEAGGSGLVNSRGVANGGLAPSGYVRLGAELWRAELGPGQPPIPPGAFVRVVAVRGLTVVVEVDPEGDS